MKIMGRPRTFQTLEEFVALMNEYFDDIEKENSKALATTGKLKRNPNIAHMCEHMGISKQNFYEYAKRTDINGKPFAHAMKMATQHIEGFKIEAATLGLLKEITTIFDLKNNHGYTDKMDINTNPTTEQLTPDEISNKLKKMQRGSEQDEASKQG
jgi:hypothetical protein